MRQETIENYLKNIYHLSIGNKAIVGNFQLAEKLNIRPASVTEGLRKLHDLKYVIYEKSYGTRLTPIGAKLALTIVRRHRIWETYLAKELGFGWDEVHEIAEELEHIQNDKLINKLSELLGNPVYDPHGDPIPDEKGKIKKENFINLSSAKPKNSYKIRGVSDHSTVFLKYLEKHRLIIGAHLKIDSIEEFDQSLIITCNKKEVIISPKVADNIIVELL
ncbi:MAG: metal-dependent transcriptional regulator [Bacteroidetes bacterium]|nr:metal-dependent transcriptional regulator [Bacteroidota bacterium]